MDAQKLTRPHSITLLVHTLTMCVVLLAVLVPQDLDRLPVLRGDVRPLRQLLLYPRDDGVLASPEKCGREVWMMGSSALRLRDTGREKGPEPHQILTSTLCSPHAKVPPYKERTHPHLFTHEQYDPLTQRPLHMRYGSCPSWSRQSWNPQPTTQSPAEMKEMNL